jgi:hypothetical protein
MTAVSADPASLADPDLVRDVEGLLRNDPAWIADPFLLYERMRASAPVLKIGNQVLVSSYAQVREVLLLPSTLQGLARDGSRFRTAHAQLDGPGADRLSQIFEFYENRLGGANGDSHTRLRRLVQSAFAPRAITAMRPRVEAVIDDLLVPLVEQNDFELIARFAYQLPLILIMELLDIPSGDREMIRESVASLADFVGSDWNNAELVARTHADLYGLRRYLQGLVAARRQWPNDSLLSSLIETQTESGDRLSDEEMLAMVTQLIFAGHETTTNLLANSLALLLGRYRGQWDQLTADPALAPAAVEEVMRFGSSVQMIDKLVGEDGVLGGTAVRRHDTVTVVLGSANRDTVLAADGENFNIARPAVRHLGFGFGAHHCLGAGLARLEVASALSVFAARFPDMAITGPLTWRPNHRLRAPERLDLRLVPVAAGREPTLTTP